MNYLDLSIKQRRAAASAHRKQIQAALADPNLTSIQCSQLQIKLDKINAWEKGTLNPNITPQTGKEPSGTATEVVQNFFQKLMPKKS